MQRRATCASCTSLARIYLDNRQQKLMWVHAAHMNRLSCHTLCGVRGMTCIKIAQVWSSDCMRSCQKQQESIPCNKLLLFCMQLRFAPDDCCDFTRVVPKAQWSCPRISYYMVHAGSQTKIDSFCSGTSCGQTLLRC